MMFVSRSAPAHARQAQTAAVQELDPALASMGRILHGAALQQPHRDSRPVVISIVVAHLLAVWGLLTVEAVHVAVRTVTPTLAEFIVAPAALQPPAPTPPSVTRIRPLTPPPQVMADRPVPEASTAAMTAVPVGPEPTPVAPAPAVLGAAPQPAAPPPPTPAASPRVAPASAVQYLVQPPIEVPLASRRLGEQGTVWLHVRVGRDGLPQQITLQKSSGFDRLDRQALDAMRLARFRPQTDNGQPIEWVVTAPLQYDIE